MIKKIVKLKRLLIELVLTLVFLGGALYYVQETPLRVGLQLILMVKSPHHDTFQLIIGNEKVIEVNVEPANYFQEVCFPLPREKIEKLRLVFGKNPGLTAVKYLEITGPLIFSKPRLEGKRLRRIFKQKYGVNNDYVKDQCYFIETAGSNHWLEPVKTFYKWIDTLQAGKASYYLLSFILALLFFSFIHFADLGILKMPVSSKIIINGVLIFLVILYIPIADQVFKISGESELVEKRQLSRKPEFRFDSLFVYPKKYTPYYNDYFAFRSGMIYLNNLFKAKIMGISPLPKVLIGKDDWFFLDKQELRPGTIECYRSMNPFTPRQLEQWRNVLEQRQQWLAARGSHYLFLVVPNKNTIYPEFMPDHIRRIHEKSRMDQLLEYLQNHSTVPVLDLRPALKAGKMLYPVYSRTDTHWNDYGAYIAYREIITHISRSFHSFKDAVSIPLSRFKIKIENRSGGDLAIMLSLNKEVFREDMIFLEAHPPMRATGGNLENISRFVKQGYSECPTAPLPNILMVHDSFYKRLEPFLSEQFSRVLFIWDWDLNFYPGIIEREKPKLVIDEMAERFLMQKIPVNPGNLK
jgi:alginate O-acetyltransferase complex protein AlgJ